ncbi:hypothetical protein [Actinoplanes sp. L3-i22]|uniref:hypothetical protein n=1 Tax=Actinoplanes sp. L3-i22 TaxID=2836373 RepID=UPI001C75D69A|nr:hypothetical protein [Actinoplanes sp. L3-i22]BCY09863.1 hypothetical protein L3i22_049510 [Actinoplanes sp. L3-i22]
MSRTDKTRPWWVQMADAPMVAGRPVHDHRRGECTLPERITAESARPGEGCFWGLTRSYWFRRVESHGYREWSLQRRADRRRSRHEARRAVRHQARRAVGGGPGAGPAGR